MDHCLCTGNQFAIRGDVPRTSNQEMEKSKDDCEINRREVISRGSPDWSGLIAHILQSFSRLLGKFFLFDQSTSNYSKEIVLLSISKSI